MSSADIAGAFVQLSQGISKGKFELEDLKSIAERFPGFFPKFAESLGVTTEKLYEFISAGKITGAEVLIFAENLKKGLSGAEFNSFENNLTRLRDSIKLAFIDIGQSGAFEALTKGVQTVTAAITGAVAIAALLGTTIEALYLKMSLGSNFDFGNAISQGMDKAAERTRSARDAMLGVKDETVKVGDAGSVAGDQIAAGMRKAGDSAADIKTAAKALSGIFKDLGLDPKQFEQPAQKINDAFAALVKNAAASGSQILTGLVGALKNLPAGESFSGLARGLDEAFKAGKITADEFGQGLALLKVAMNGLSPSFKTATEAAKPHADQLNESAKAAEKAREAAEKYKLEMEKLASNERIKLIEANVELKIANVEANAKIVMKTFESIDNTINSTGTALDGLFKLFGNDKLGFSEMSDVRQQIETENKRRDEALQLQKRLIEAQISNIQAQTKALDKGDALIKIDGAGLQPHLEAFMFEILRAIQVRVNSQGLDLLIG